MLDFHRPTISEIEAGRRRVPAEELAELARIYDVSVSWLAGEKSEADDPVADRIHLAARELLKLKKEDMDRVLKLLRTLREPEENER